MQDARVGRLVLRCEPRAGVSACLSKQLNRREAGVCVTHNTCTSMDLFCPDCARFIHTPRGDGKLQSHIMHHSLTP